MGRYRRPLTELEAEAHVPRDKQVEEQDADPPREYLDPDAFERQQLLNNPAGSWRLHPENR